MVQAKIEENGARDNRVLELIKSNLREQNKVPSHEEADEELRKTKESLPD